MSESRDICQDCGANYDCPCQIKASLAGSGGAEYLRPYAEDEHTEHFRNRITNLCADLCTSELRFVHEVVRRIHHGRRQYGPLNPHDGRNWTQEALEEAIDLSFYLSAKRQQETT